MENSVVDIDQKVRETTSRLKKEFYMIADQSNLFVKRIPRNDRLDDFQQKLYEACTLLHVMTDVLIGHSRKTIDNLESEIHSAPNKDEIIDRVEETAIEEIPNMVKEAMMKRIK